MENLDKILYLPFWKQFIFYYGPVGERGVGANLLEADKVDKDTLLEIALVGLYCLKIKVTALLSIWVNSISLSRLHQANFVPTQWLCPALHTRWFLYKIIGTLNNSNALPPSTVAL